MQLNGALEVTSCEESSASVAAMYPIDDFSYIISLLLPASYSRALVSALVSITSTSGWVSAGVADNSDIPITVATKASIMTRPTVISQ